MLSFHRILAGAAAALALTAQAAAAAPQIAPFRTITLKDGHSVADAMTVNAAIDRMLSAAGSCHSHGLEVALSCACAATGDLDRLKAAYRQTSMKHPDWNEPNTIVAYRNPANGHFISLNFAATSSMIARCDKR